MIITKLIRQIFPTKIFWKKNRLIFFKCFTFLKYLWFLPGQNSPLIIQGQLCTSYRVCSCPWIIVQKDSYFLVNCKWSNWGNYSACPVTCGGGTQIKIRTKLVVEDHGGVCHGLSHQERQCNTYPCPYPGILQYYTPNYCIQIKGYNSKIRVL